MIRYFGVPWWVAISIVVAITYGCDDQINYGGNASTEAGNEMSDDTQPFIDPQQISHDLTIATWGWDDYTAALCNDNHERWTFHPDKTVENTSRSDVYNPDDEGYGCSSRVNTSQGSFLVDEMGVARISFEGKDLYAWQVGVFEVAPKPDFREGTLQHTEANGIFTTRAYVAAPEIPHVFTQYFKEPGYAGQHNESTTTVAFNDALTAGACHATVSIMARSVSDDEPETEASETFEFSCNIDDTGLEGWMAIIITEEVEFREVPDRTRAESILHSAHWGYTHTNRLLFYYNSDTHMLIHPYQDCCDSSWMTAR